MAREDIVAHSTGHTAGIESPTPLDSAHVLSPSRSVLAVSRPSKSMTRFRHSSPAAKLDMPTGRWHARDVQYPTGDHAAATLVDSDVATAEDVALGGSLLWSITGIRAAPMLVLPDLSIDVAWTEGDLPTVTERTLTAFGFPIRPGETFTGIRFAPAVGRVSIDTSWSGWRSGSSSPRIRSEILAAALEVGAIRPTVDDRLATLLAALGRPGARMDTAASELNVSQRQLRRWSRAAVGLTPKGLQRRLRLRRFCSLDRDLPLADRSLIAGFYDQAHAANEIRALTGLTSATLAAFEVADSSKTPGRHPG